MELFSIEEIRDIITTITIITLIFTFVWTKPLFYGTSGFISFFPYFLVLVIIVFLFHELAHKFVARKFGAMAFFKIWPTGIIFGLIAMFANFVLIAPGAVVIYPFKYSRWRYKRIHIEQREMGLIAAAGPLVNLTFAAIFALFEGWFFGLLVFINSWLAFFNLLPIKPLDGSKVLSWKPWFWLVLIIISGALAIPFIIG